MKEYYHETRHGREALGFLKGALERDEAGEIEIENVTLRVNYKRTWKDADDES